MKSIKRKPLIYLIPMVVVFIVIVTIYYSNYENTKNIIISEYKAKMSLIEQSLHSETKYTEIISKIAEKDLEKDMEENSKAILEIYNNDKNILEWNYIDLKHEFDEMDIYVLDKDLKIVASSIEEEIGLDFTIYPDYLKLLQERLEGNKFESDTMNFSMLKGELKKYSFMPTGDNKYLIELSVDIKDKYPELRNLNIIYMSRNLKDNYKFIEEIRVYNYNRDRDSARDLDTENKKSSQHSDITTDGDLYIKRALEKNEIQEQVIRGGIDGNYTLRYIPYRPYSEENSMTWWKSYVIEVIYNDQILIDDIDNQKKILFRSLTIISILYFGFSLIILKLLERNRELANIDYITKLPNRRKFEEVTQDKILESNRKDDKFAMLFFDLDKFKTINDTYGHNIGDKVLQEVANIIRNNVREEDFVSRLGGDEFTALILDVKSNEEIVEIGERMLGLFEKPLNIGGKEISIKSSIGISIYPDHGLTVNQLLLKADNSMYEAKNKGLGYKIHEEKEM